MLLSMTGHGQGHWQADGVVATVEVRTVNSRYFKISVRSGEGLAALETRIETVIRHSVRRGTVQVNVKVDRQSSPDDFRINDVVLNSYRRQLRAIDDTDSPPLHTLLLLPGVVEEQGPQHLDEDREWAVTSRALELAMQDLEKMRIDEGRIMSQDLVDNCQAIAGHLEQIAVRAPLVVEAYRSRLTERLNTLLQEFEVQVQASDVIREVGVFAERSDISEEIVRLKSHLEQFAAIMQSPDSSGRKLEFLIQEMFRETNTIGSKANDAEISRNVIDIKAAIERMREMIQNVE